MKASSSSSSSSRSPPQHKYDVFLSFHGKDTRKSFTDHLYAALKLRGIVTFKDDINLNRGENIKYGLPKAIEESRISLVVFSKNYAESEWCLEELVKLMECSKRSDQQHTVLPIFYDVKPAEVRAQKDSVADSLAKHQNCSRKVEKWRETLHEFANLSGFVLEDMSSGHEAKNIQIIVKYIEEKLNHVSLSVVDHPVGIEPHLHRLIEMLNIDCDDTRIITIWGIGGIGKTEIAKTVYNMVHQKFEHSSFIADVRAVSNQPNGMVSLQKQILSNILRTENHNIGSVHHGIELIRRRIFCRKVLLVLDDVDHAKQLKELAINRNYLCRGSKIIITTRVRSSVNSLKEDEVYEPKELNERQSIELFSWHAFEQDHPMEDYMELSNEVVSYLKGIPLALEVIGSLLFKRTKPIWRSAMTELKTIPNHEVQKKLKISFDSLSDERKELFLDIACFFVGENRDFTIEILKGCDFHPEIGMQELVERCLLKYDQSNKIIVHDLLRDMGREIIRHESITEPGERSRLWHDKDALKVLTEGTGTKKVEGLFLDFLEPRDVQANAKAFEKMERLRLLHLNYVQLTAGYEHIISKRLVLLCWKGFPLDHMPSNLHMENLVHLDLSYSNLKYVWTGTKVLNKLKILDLSHCSFLVKTPEFSALDNLEKLLLGECTNLVVVDNSISCLNKLIVLDMSYCKKLKTLPCGIMMLKSLEDLNLLGCSNLRTFAGFKGSSSLLYSLYSSWISPTMKVGSVDLQAAKSRLRELRMSYSNLSYIPNEIGYLTSLKEFDISGNNFSTLPDSIGDLRQLRLLRVSESRRLQSVPKLPPSLWTMFANRCISLESISMESNWQKEEGGLPTVVICYGSPKLVENNFADRCSKGLLQYKGISAIGNSFDVFLTGGEVPNWFEYRSTGSYLSFMASNKIRGWIVCVVFKPPKEGSYRPLYYIQKNFNYHVTQAYQPCVFFDAADMVRNMNVMWFSYLPLSAINMRVKCGDEVEISLRRPEPFQVIEWGISVIHKDEEEESEEEEEGYLWRIMDYPQKHKEKLDDHEMEDVDEVDKRMTMKRKTWMKGMKWRRTRGKRRRKNMEEEEEEEEMEKNEEEEEEWDEEEEEEAEAALSQTKKIIIDK